MAEQAELPVNRESSQPPPPPPIPEDLFRSAPPPPLSTDGAGGLSAIRKIVDSEAGGAAGLEQGLVVGRNGLAESESARRVRIVCISDTHEKHKQYKIPDGDILVHTGDFFSYLRPQGDEHFAAAVGELNKFFASQPHRHKIFVAGNHEIAFYHAGARRIRALLTSAHYLEDSSCVCEGIKFFGSPWTYCRGMGFPGGPAEKMAKRWDAIPNGTDVLLTHNPPLGILDLAWVNGMKSHDCKVCGAAKHWNRQHWGCSLLRQAVLKRVRPLVHAFGHVHDTHGAEHHGGVLFVNSAMDLTPRPIVIDVCVPDISETGTPSSTTSETTKKTCCVS